MSFKRQAIFSVKETLVKLILLEIKNIYKSYNHAIYAVKDVSLSIFEGLRAVLLGQNGYIR